MPLFSSSNPGIRVRVLPKFPSQVLGSNGITVTKSNGIYTISWSQAGFAELSPPISSTDFDNLLLTVYNEDTGTTRNISIETLFTGITADIDDPRIVTTSPVTVTSTDRVIVISRAAPTATTITLPSATSRGGLPLSIVDYSTAVTEHTITITPNGTDKIMQQTTWGLISTSASLASMTLYPSTTLAGWFTAP